MGAYYKLHKSETSTFKQRTLLRNQIVYCSHKFQDQNEVLINFRTKTESGGPTVSGIVYWKTIQYEIMQIT